MTNSTSTDLLSIPYPLVVLLLRRTVSYKSSPIQHTSTYITYHGVTDDYKRRVTTIDRTDLPSVGGMVGFLF